MKELYDAYSWPFRDSKILNTPILQKNLIKLCEFSYCSEWVLLYRENEHGFGAKEFDARCDIIPKTLTIIQSSNGNIFGGYTDVEWDCSNKLKKNNDAFIFSLINENDNQIRVKIDPNESEFAIVCDELAGPIFGDGHDIYISNNCDTQMQSYSLFPCSYKCPNIITDWSRTKSILAGTYKFNVSNIEVFHLIKNDSN